MITAGLLRPEDADETAELLGADPYLNLYSIGDLDERFRPYIDWYGLKTSGRLSCVVCVYKGGDSPTLMALTKDPSDGIQELLQHVIPLLPGRIQAHLSPGLEGLFLQAYSTESAKMHYKMALTDTARSYAEAPTSQDRAVRLGKADIPQLLELYDESYPGNWFEPDMLDINLYCGIRESGEQSGGKLICAAGTHVYSPEHKAAALGNITTRPEYRGRGYGVQVTAAISSMLLQQGIRVGLNVKQDNAAGIACYTNAGFSIHAEYCEYIFSRKPNTITA